MFWIDILGILTDIVIGNGPSYVFLKCYSLRGMKRGRRWEHLSEIVIDFWVLVALERLLLTLGKLVPHWFLFRVFLLLVAVVFYFL